MKAKAKYFRLAVGP